MQQQEKHCVVMGPENLEPQRFVDALRDATSSLSSTVVVVHLETACIPKPYIVQLSPPRNSNTGAAAAAAAGQFPPQAPTLHAAFILFSPMRPLSFVRLDAFLDRVLHVASLKIVIVVVEVDVLSSSSAIASLKDSSRCRPVSLQDLQRYVALKRRWLRRIDEQEAASHARWGDYHSASSSSLKPRRELVVFVQPARRNQFLENAVEDFVGGKQREHQLRQQRHHRYLKRLIDWCFLPPSSADQSPPSVASPVSTTATNAPSSGKDDDDDDDDDAQQRQKQQEQGAAGDDNRVAVWNETQWSTDWRHEVQSAKSFFEHQRQLFGRSNINDADAAQESSAASPAVTAAEEWVVISLKAVPPSSAAADQHINNNASTMTTSPSNLLQRKSSSALFSSSYNLRRAASGMLSRGASNVGAAHAAGASSPSSAGNSAAPTPLHNAAQQQQQHQQQRFAFWNPRTGQVSLTVPKALVIDRQTTTATAVAGSDNNNDNTRDEEQHAAPLHLARKAMLTAAERRIEDRKQADRAAAEKLQRLQQQLTAAERRHRELQNNKAALERQSVEHKAKREQIKQQVFDVQKKKATLQMQMMRTSGSAGSGGGVAAQRSRDFDAVVDRIEFLESQISLSAWKNKRAERWQQEVDDYEASGGKPERSRLYFAKFIDNQQLRSDLHRVEARNNEIQEQIDQVRGKEWLPLSMRRQLLEARKEQLLDEINSLLRDDMQSTVPLGKFLTRLARKNQRRRRRFPYSEIAGLNASDNEDDNLFLDEDSDEDVKRLKSRQHVRSNSSSSSSSSSSSGRRSRRSASSDYLSELSSSDSRSSSSGSNTSELSNDDAPPARLFGKVITRLRSAMRRVQRTLVLAGGDFRPLKLCKSTALHQVLASRNSLFDSSSNSSSITAQTSFFSPTSQKSAAAAATNSPSRTFALTAASFDPELTSWIDSFSADAAHAVTSVPRQSLSSSTLSAIPSLAEYAEMVWQRRWIVVQAEEHIRRCRTQFEQAVEVAQIWGAAATHSRNLAVRGIKFAKAKRRALFGGK